MKKYLVGGAVRDKLLGLKPKDLDWVLVGATPHEIEVLMNEGYTQVGADFPVLLHPITGDEYALARVERKNGVGYLGFDVRADETVTIEEDLARRDLTINSMAMDEHFNLIDPHGGMKDLHNHVLRHTSPAFAEDPLRVLRLARFHARLPSWNVAKETLTMCERIGHAGELNALSVERIWVELEKGFREPSPMSMFSTLDETHALHHCKVLRGIFGSSLTAAQKHALTAVQAVIAPDDRLIVGTVLMAKPDAVLVGASHRMNQAHESLNAMLNLERCSTALSHMLKKIGALREGPAFHDAVKIASIMELGGDKRLSFGPKQLTMGQRLMMDVKARDFPDLQGKALGQAIDHQRTVNLEQAMSIPEGNDLNPKAR